MLKKCGDAMAAEDLNLHWKKIINTMKTA